MRESHPLEHMGEQRKLLGKALSWLSTEVSVEWEEPEDGFGALAVYSGG